jgi:hypothetical protein
MTARWPKDKINFKRENQAGDVIVGFESSGQGQFTKQNTIVESAVMVLKPVPPHDCFT